MTPLETKMAELQARLAQRCRSEHAALRAAMDRNDREVLIDRSHKLAGIAGMLGAPQIGDAALRLEESVLKGDPYEQDAMRLLALLDEASA